MWKQYSWYSIDLSTCLYVTWKWTKTHARHLSSVHPPVPELSSNVHPVALRPWGISRRTVRPSPLRLRKNTIHRNETMAFISWLVYYGGKTSTHLNEMRVSNLTAKRTRTLKQMRVWSTCNNGCWSKQTTISKWFKTLRYLLSRNG